jgi:lysophosphatidylcholine acyltransferase/lyso-PAF acetyltransferase
MMYLLAASGVSRMENKDIPIIGTAILGFQTVFVSRDRPAASSAPPTKSRSVAAIIADRVADPRWPMVVVAPEGTCGDGRCLLRFRSGAFVPGAPVLPILVSYERAHFNPAWTIVHEGAHFLRLLCQFRKRVRVRVLPPYRPSPAERADPSLYAANVRRLFADELGVPVVDQGYEEFAALLRAGVGVGADCATVTAPPGVVDGDGFADLTVRRRRSNKSE